MSRKTYSGQLVIKRNLKTPSVEKSAEGYCFRGRELAQNILRRFFGTILGQIYMKNPSESISKGFYRDSIRVTKLTGGGQALNLHRWDICKAAYEKGRREGTLVYQFLKKPLEDMYGEEFYSALDAAAKHLLSDSESELQG